MSDVAPRLQRQGDWRAAGHFICGGTGAGFFLFAALASLVGSQGTWPGLLALVFVGSGLFLVWPKTSHPWRSFKLLFHPQTSWMTREALVAIPLIILGLAGAWFGWRALVLVAAVFGLVFLYCQAHMLNAAKGIPAWQAPKIVPLMITTGLCEGAGLFLATEFFQSPASPGMASILAAYALLALIIARFWIWLAYRNSLADGDAAELAVATLRGINSLFIGLGHALPTSILVGSLVLPDQGAILHALAGLFALAGGWMLKFTIVTRAAYYQGSA
jgi:phenylacetyl-CoA:acceptor oxidoreductase subunit 2